MNRLAATALRGISCHGIPVHHWQLKLLSQTRVHSKKSLVYPKYFQSSSKILSAIKNGNSQAEKKNTLRPVPDVHPQPVRSEFLNKQMSSEELEKWDIGLELHRVPESFGDRIALFIVRALRVPADMFFKKKYLHRAVTLETVAAVPGMVGATLRHLRSLRKLKHDGGWIHHLLHEAENERMHLLTWMKICQPTFPERLLVTTVQGVFYNCFFILYLFAPRVAHRMVGYLEEEAIKSYTAMLREIDAGNIENVPAPEIAIGYWNMPANAKLRDVVLAVRADEAMHRDTNHYFSDRIVVGNEDLRDSYDPKYNVVGKEKVATDGQSIDIVDVKLDKGKK